MADLIQLGMLVPAGTAACCFVANRQRRLAHDWLPAIVMLGAMIDLSLASALGREARVPAVIWMAALIGCAFVVSLAVRRARLGVSPMTVQRALSCIGMAALMLSHGATAANVAAHRSPAPMPMPISISTVSIGPLIPAGVVAVAVFGGMVAARQWRHSRLDAIDAGSMSLSLVVMTLMHLE